MPSSAGRRLWGCRLTEKIFLLSEISVAAGPGAKLSLCAIHTQCQADRKSTCSLASIHCTLSYSASLPFGVKAMYGLLSQYNFHHFRTRLLTIPFVT